MPNSDEIAIIVEHVGKTFEPQSSSRTIKEAFVGLGRRVTGKKKLLHHKGEYTALKDISFEVKKGEFFGIVGRNGCGKSTLLKILAGVYTPSKGHVRVNGKLTPFIELGVGFNPDLSGKDNVYLNGALLGFTRNQIDSMYDDIVDFAELHNFMDTKLKNYSSGMQVRLAFSVAIRAKSDILLIDEVLAVGDAAFQQKCFAYFNELKKEGRTVLLVTHDMGSVERFCTKALLIEEGVIKTIGKPSNVAKQYTLDNVTTEKKYTKADANKRLSSDVESLDIKLISNKIVKQSERLVFEVAYKLKGNIKVDLGISVIRDGRSVIEHNTKELELDYSVSRLHKLRYEYELDLLNPGRYDVTVAIFEKSNFKLIGFNTDSCSFIIEGRQQGGVLKEIGRWTKVYD